MDGPCSYEELRRCLRHLAVVNRITRAHRPILMWLERVASSNRKTLSGAAPRPLKIVDFGSGYGDMLRRIEGWAAQRGVAVELIGVDINANAIRAAREATSAHSRIQWVHGDVHTCATVADADLVATCGVLHHLAEPEIVRFLRWAEQTARAGWFVVDLHRKPMPYRVFDLTMRGPWWHPYIHADGLRSIRRSFLEEDWKRICAAAGLDAAAIAIVEHRPARLCLERMKTAPR